MSEQTILRRARQEVISEAQQRLSSAPERLRPALNPFAWFYYHPWASTGVSVMAGAALYRTLTRPPVTQRGSAEVEARSTGVAGELIGSALGLAGTMIRSALIAQLTAQRTQEEVREVVEPELQSVAGE